MIRLSKIKIDPTQQFLMNGPITFLPQTNQWLFEVQNSSMLQLTVIGNYTDLEVTDIAGGWTSYSFNVVYNNHTIFAYGKGMAAWIDIITGVITPFKKFPCPGSISVDFVYQVIYYYSDCTQLQVESTTFKNVTKVYPLDPSLANSFGIQAITPYTPYLCGTPCSVNTDCQMAHTCSTCRASRCVSTGSCGDFCISAADCFAGVCVGDCELNRCGRRGCGALCNSHDDCTMLSKDCQTCRLGKCVDFGDCGAYCQTNLDCYSGQCTMSCSHFTCVIPS